jgi:hypothetical protein
MIRLTYYDNSFVLVGLLGEYPVFYRIFSNKRLAKNKW